MMLSFDDEERTIPVTRRKWKEKKDKHLVKLAVDRRTGSDIVVIRLTSITSPITLLRLPGNPQNRPIGNSKRKTNPHFRLAR